MSKPRIAIIGCGHNASSQATAFREAGWELAAACAKPGSPRLHPFADKFGVSHRHEGVESLFETRDQWDALLIVITVKETLAVLQQALELQVPILCEKPVSYWSEDLKPFLGQNLPVLVGYNRRFYRPVAKAKAEVEHMPPFIGQMVFPQNVRLPERPEDDPTYLEWYYSSVTIHSLDMARYILGDLEVVGTNQMRNEHGTLLGIAATLRTVAGSLIQFTGNFEASSNFSIIFDWPGHRFELRPLEFATVYEGLDVHGPMEGRSISAYLPRIVETINLDEVDLTFNPGFVRQAQALLELLEGKDPGPAARLEDAYEALVLAEKLAGENFPRTG